MSFKVFLLSFILILFGILGVFGYWSFQRNVYSKEILKLEILAPAEINFAANIEYIVKYKNNGNVRLEEPKLFFEYPKYTIVDEGKGVRQELALEDIYPGQEKTISFKGRLLGKEGETRKANVLVTYRPKNLNARYESETSHTTIIKSVPINFEFDLPSKIESGKEVRFRLNYFSNTDYPLSGLRIKADYPSGFEFQNSTPKALDKNEWEIGLLNKAEGGRIEISGKLSGEVGEEKKFQAQLGSWQDGEFILFKETIRGVQIVKPALYISQQINGNPKYVANPSDILHYEILFKNIGEEALENMFLIARLEGRALDFQTLKAPLGDFEAGDNSVIFDWKRVSKLQLLESRDEGRVEFWINLKENWEVTGPQDKNQELHNKIYLSQAREEFITKVNSRLELSQKGFFNDEVFGNSGPIPPKAGETTTYTVIWQVKNYFNDVKNVKVRATLGEGVKLTGKISPGETRLTFDSQSREVIWEIGDMEAGKGVLNPAPNVAFQVAFTPNYSQKGKMGILSGEARITGIDSWTEITLEEKFPGISAGLPDDETISDEQGIIQ